MVPFDAPGRNATPRPGPPPAPGRAALCGEGEAPEAWDLTLPEAIRTALDRSESIRVISLGVGALGGQAFESTDPAFDIRDHLPAVDFPAKPGGPAAAAKPLMIARLRSGDDLEGFRSEAMALVRTVQERYWALAARDVSLRAGESALRRARSVVDGARARTAPVAFGEASLEGFRLEAEAAASEHAQAQRQLRAALGLDPEDRRRIVPATAPREAGLEPDWEAAFDQLMDRQPDIRWQRTLDELARIRLMMARNVLVHEAIGGRPPASFDRSVVNTRQAQYQLARQREAGDEATRRAFAAFSAEAIRVRAALRQCHEATPGLDEAAGGLEATRIEYEAGRGTGDRYLDALGAWSHAVAREAQDRARYNAALAALEEAQGTSLDAANIAVAEGPRSRHPYGDALRPAREPGHNSANPGPPEAGRTEKAAVGAGAG